MKKPEYLGSLGYHARLMPVSSQPELRNTSVTCAVLKSVSEFADNVLGGLGAPTGMRAKVTALVEPTFKANKGEKPARPDAIIIVDNGRRTWRALVEAKVKNAVLEAAQIERYLDVAKQHNIDAVITISNQFVSTPRQSPCDIPRNKTKRVDLFHWSWSYLETEAKIQLSKSAVSDPDQAFILEEYVRYLEHVSSGVSEFDQMGKEWVEACKMYFAKTKLDKNSPLAPVVVSNWDELLRCAALRLSRNLETNVTTVLSPKERKDPSTRLNTMMSNFISSGLLESKLDVPNAASTISVEADLNSRSLTVSMVVAAPKDKKRATASVNWLVRQLKSTDDSIMILAKWPGRAGDTCKELGVIRENPEELVLERKGLLPHSFELRAVSDLGGKFIQRRNFVPEVIGCVSSFYDSVGQHVVAWQAHPPKPRKETALASDVKEMENGKNNDQIFENLDIAAHN